jgi:hypothetical protein
MINFNQIKQGLLNNKIEPLYISANGGQDGKVTNTSQEMKEHGHPTKSKILLS